MDKGRFYVAQYLKESLPRVRDFDTQSRIFCKIVETMSDEFNDDPGKAIKIRMLFIQHGKGLKKNGDLLRLNPDYSDQALNRITDIQSKIQLYIDMLIEEMIRITVKTDPRPENEIEAEIEAEAEKNKFDYSSMLTFE